MFYLIIGILCSALISIILRMSEKHLSNKMVMFASNYMICVLCSLFFMKGNHIVLEVLYEVEEPALLEDNGRYAAIDLGIDNLCSVSSNCCNSFIINGKPVKSINQYYNKKKAKLQRRVKKCQKRNKSKRLNKLTEKRNRKVIPEEEYVELMTIGSSLANDFETKFEKHTGADELLAEVSSITVENVSGKTGLIPEIDREKTQEMSEMIARINGPHE